MSNIQKIFTSLLIIGLLSGCAKRGAPPGGPADITPPRVISTIPADGDTLVPNDSKIIINFDEPVKSNQNTILIYPPIDDMSIRFSSKSVKIIHREPLKDSTTYSLILTPEFSDRHGNPIGKSFEAAFSTGRTLDTLILDGCVFDGELFSGVANATIAVYSDSIMSQPPMRITFSADNGTFNIKHLPYRKLWLFAGVGIGIPLEWERATKVAIPAAPTIMPKKNPITLVLTSVDTIPPKLIAAGLDDNVTMRIKFDEKVIIDSLAAKFSDAISWFDPVDSLCVLISTNALALGGTLSFRVSDKCYNCASIDVGVPSAVPHDTMPPVSIMAKKSAVLPNQPLRIVLSEPFSAKIKVKSNDSAMVFDTSMISPNIVELNFRVPPPRGANIVVLLDSLCDRFGNCSSDTVAFVVSEEKYGDVIVSGFWLCEKPVMFLRDAAKHSVVLHMEGAKFLRALPAGAYSVWRFCDINRDGMWTSGKLVPFRYSEPMEVFSDTISVRAGWDTEIMW